MIRLYAFSTPNSIKVPVLLEELELPYTLHGVNIRQGEQKLAAFTAMNPNVKVPVRCWRRLFPDLTAPRPSASGER
jgi:GST-like protein